MCSCLALSFNNFKALGFIEPAFYYLSLILKHLDTSSLHTCCVSYHRRMTVVWQLFGSIVKFKVGIVSIVYS